FSISTGLEASTVTPGSTPPEGSLTVPDKVAWAEAASGTPMTIATANSNCFIGFMHTSPWAAHRDSDAHTLARQAADVQYIFQCPGIRIWYRIRPPWTSGTLKRSSLLPTP